jgi:predicted DsbA family dithiol-disulfide isomerase
MGDLVQDRRLDRPDFDAERAAPKLSDYWRSAYEHTGMSYPARLRWAPMRSDIPGQAVKAAEQQGDDIGGRLLRALRESCFVYSAPADDLERIAAIGKTVEGLDIDRLRAELASAERAFAADRAETRAPNEYVRTLDETHWAKGNAKPDGDGWRYVFPTLLFRGPGGEHTVPGWQPWERYVDAMEAAVPGSTNAPRPDPTPEQAFAEWSLLTQRELEVLCGVGAVVPDDARPYDWGDGTAWLRAGAVPQD